MIRFGGINLVPWLLIGVVILFPVSVLFPSPSEKWTRR